MVLAEVVVEGGGTWISFSVNEEAGWQGGYDDVRLVVTALALGAGRPTRTLKKGCACSLRHANQLSLTIS